MKAHTRKYRTIKSIAAAVAFAFCCMSGAFAQSVISWPGLMQAKFSTPQSLSDSYALDVMDDVTAERVLGAVMANVKADESSYSTALYYNPLSGNSWGWNKQYTAFGYVGQMAMEEGVTYTFGKYLDDGARVVVDGVTVLESANYNAWMTGAYTATNSGWVDIDIRIYDGTGGKGPAGSSWGNDLGLAFNTNKLTAMTPKAGWTKLLDPGDGSRFRVEVPVTETQPVFYDPPTVEQTSQGTVVTATLTHGEGDVYALAGAAGVYDVTNLLASAVTAPYTVSASLNVPTNTAFTVAVYAENALGESTVREPMVADVFYSGDIWLEFVKDASEENLEPGIVRVHRAGTPESVRLPLVVNYTVNGITAVEATNYEPFSGSVTIPADAATADILVMPLVDSGTSADTTLAITLAAGNYYDTLATPISVTILDWEPPSEYNIWIAPQAGNASDAANWTMGVPTTTDKIMLGIFTSSDMTWDAGVNGLPDTVAEWTQAAEYTGTVTFNTTYPDYDTTFTNFTVTGDALVAGGAWTHPANSATQAYRLCVTVGGDFELSTDAKIDLRRKGYAANKFPTGGQAGIHGGGRASWTTTYGSPYEPKDIGAGGATLAGGGALWLVVDGNATFDGLVRSDSSDNVGVWTSVGAGAGGSIYVKAASIAGTGKISASSLLTDANTTVPGGGRIALVLTQADSLALPIANVTAYGTTGPTSTGAGTILVKTPGQQYGTLYVKNRKRTNRDNFAQVTTKGTTIIPPGATWAFDRIMVSEFGILSVPEGAVLKLEGGFSAVSGTGSDYTAGIVYEGGTFDFGDCAAPWVFSSNWVFHANTPLTIDADVRVIDGGAIGLLRFSNRGKTSWTKMDLTVNGDLIVDASSWINARASGFDFCSPNAGSPGTATVDQLNGHGGQQGSSIDAVYGSILNPVMPGSSGWRGDGNYTVAGGGVVLLRVTGELQLDGIAESTGNWNGRSPGWDESANVGPGGSINIVAGSLSGTGQIRAYGLERSYNSGASKYFWGHSGGGRIAIRLTDADATFDNFGVANITAKGGSKNTTGDMTNRFSSAGTIYLQAASQAEGAGTIIVRNDNNPLNVFPFTVIPALTYGGLDDDLSATTLLVEDCARVKLSTSLRMKNVVMQENTALDLNACQLTVDGITIGGEKVVFYGTFTAQQLTDLGFVGIIDTSETEDGTVEIVPQQTTIIIR